MSAVGTGMEVGIHPNSTWNNPEPEVVLVGQRPRPDRRRDARQRRQPARLRGPLGAAARQGQGQQRLLRHRPVHPPVRRAASRSTTCAAPTVTLDVEGRGRLRARGLVARSPRSAATRPTSSRRRSGRITSIRTAPCCSSAPCSRRSRTATRRARASPTRSATSSPSRRRSSARLVNRMRHATIAPPWTFGAGALMRNLAARRLI